MKNDKAEARGLIMVKQRRFRVETVTRPARTRRKRRKANDPGCIGDPMSDREALATENRLSPHKAALKAGAARWPNWHLAPLALSL